MEEHFVLKFYFQLCSTMSYTKNERYQKPFLTIKDLGQPCHHFFGNVRQDKTLFYEGNRIETPIKLNQYNVPYLSFPEDNCLFFIISLLVYGILRVCIF